MGKGIENAPKDIFHATLFGHVQRRATVRKETKKPERRRYTPRRKRWFAILYNRGRAEPQAQDADAEANAKRGRNTGASGPSGSCLAR